MTTFIHDPDATLDYSIDWSAWLQPGETIVASTWHGVPDEMTIGTDAHAPSHTDTKTTVWLSGGHRNRRHKITNRVTTSAGRVDDRSITLTVRHR